MRWHPLLFDNMDADLIDGMHTLVANGDAEAQAGIGALVYLANGLMERRPHPRPLPAGEREQDKETLAMKTTLNKTHDPKRRSWVASANEADCDFPIQTIALGECVGTVAPAAAIK